MSSENEMQGTAELQIKAPQDRGFRHRFTRDKQPSRMGISDLPAGGLPFSAAFTSSSPQIADGSIQVVCDAAVVRRDGVPLVNLIIQTLRE